MKFSAFLVIVFLALMLGACTAEQTEAATPFAIIVADERPVSTPTYTPTVTQIPLTSPTATVVTPTNTPTSTPPPVEIATSAPQIGELHWEIKDTLTDEILDFGTLAVFPEDIHVEQRVTDDGSVFYAKSVALNSTFSIKISIFPRDSQADFTGFGLSLNRDDLDTFSWDWFVVSSENLALKLQEGGQLAYSGKIVNSKWEITRTSFLTDVDLRAYSRDADSGSGEEPRWRATVFKDSYIDWSP